MLLREGEGLSNLGNTTSVRVRNIDIFGGQSVDFVNFTFANNTGSYPDYCSQRRLLLPLEQSEKSHYQENALDEIVFYDYRMLESLFYKGDF